MGTRDVGKIVSDWPLHSVTECESVLLFEKGLNMKKKVFVSFDYEKDRLYYYLLKAWDANSNFDFTMVDKTPNEIQSDSVAVVKRALSRKIDEASYTLVIIGEEANKLHPDHIEIGYRNWQNYEVAKSFELGNRLVGVKIDDSNEAPEQLYGKGATWARAFSKDSIIAALNKA